MGVLNVKRCPTPGVQMFCFCFFSMVRDRLNINITITTPLDINLIITIGTIICVCPFLSCFAVSPNCFILYFVFLFMLAVVNYTPLS